MITEAFSRALLNDGRFDVWIDAGLSRDIERLSARSGADQSDDLASISRRAPRVDYVIAGKVTDFHHTADLPEGAPRRGLLGIRREAIVAIDFRVIDLRTQRVVGADHIKATAPAGEAPASEVYDTIALDSYLFWSTPLGRASKQAVHTAVKRAAAIVPSDPVDARIVGHVARRRVEIAGGRRAGLVEGRQYYILLPSAVPGELRPVPDDATGRPLTLRVDIVTGSTATGWIMGERPLAIDLRGAVLRASLPDRSAASSGASSERISPHVGAAATGGD
jgi:hypothetical protein